MKKSLLILLLPLISYGAPLIVNNVPIVFTPTSLSNGPMSVVNGTNVNNQGALKSYSLTATNDLNFGATLNGIASNVVQRISGLTSDAQTQITANGAAITLLNTATTGLTNGLITTSNTLSGQITYLNIVSNGLITTSNTVGTLSGNLNSVSNGLITTSNRVETVNGLNVKLAGDTMTGSLLVTQLTNSGLSVSQLIGTDANKKQISVSYSSVTNAITFGLGITNNGSIVSNNIVVSGNDISIVSGANGQLTISSSTNAFNFLSGITNNSGAISNNIVAGSNITITKGANDQLTIAATSSGSGAPVGTVVNTGASTIGTLARYTDLTGTNVSPSVINADGSGNLIVAGITITNYSRFKTVQLSYTSATNLTMDLNAGSIFYATLTNTTFIAIPSNIPTDIQNIYLHLKQDGTGGRVVTFASNFKFQSGTAPTITTTASALSMLSMTRDPFSTTNFNCVSGLDFK